MVHSTKNVTETGTQDTAGKPMLSLKEASKYMGFSLGYMYKLTMQRRIPHYKPNGKNVFFDKRELDAWLHGNRVATSNELTRTANEHLRRMEGVAV